MIRLLPAYISYIWVRPQMGKNGDKRRASILSCPWYACMPQNQQVSGVQTPQLFGRESFFESLNFLCVSHLGFQECGEITKLAVPNPLPANIQILSLENWTSSSGVLMRLQNLEEKNLVHLKVDPREILQHEYLECHVTDLAGMRAKEECGSAGNITFQPREIVTFLLNEWDEFRWLTKLCQYLFCEDCNSYQKLLLPLGILSWVKVFCVVARTEIQWRFFFSTTMKYCVFLLCLTFSAANQSKSREGKFSLFNIVQFKNDPCEVSDTETGICYTTEECSQRGGESRNTCAAGFGVCCLCKWLAHCTA